LEQVTTNPAAAKPPPPESPKAATHSFIRLRHVLVILSFVLVVIVPTVLTGNYLYTLAADQYASKVGFAVRNEESSSAFELFGNITNLSGSSSSDTDILYEFIQGQELVEMVDADLDLRTIYSKPQDDWVFRMDPDASIEDVMKYWENMVRIVYDPGTGLLEIEARAFDPEDARNIVQAIFDRSSMMINELSTVARSDLTRYARDELDQAIERLKDARQALTLFRNENQIVDPSADIQGQMGLLNSLQAQLADTLIELDMLSVTSSSGDPRLTAAQLRSEVIQNRINLERRNLGVAGGDGNSAFADLIGQFESLQVDLQFGQEAYVASLTAYDGSIAEARRQNRYLAAYLNPTLAQTPQYPQREIILILLGLLLFGSWAILVLVYYSLRDRR
jgi:capsular polysaccharide transport system permease protein